MKEFFKYVFATICGIIILGIIAGIMFMISVAGMVAASSSPTKVEKNSVFVLKLNGVISERAEEGSPLDALLGEADMSSMGLDDIVSAIRKAKDEENIKGIYLEGGATSFDAPATAQQVRDALEDFKKSGKWIIAYADQYMQGSYYVASVADSLFLNKTGMIDFKGLGGKNYYMTGLYEKIGDTQGHERGRPRAAHRLSSGHLAALAEGYVGEPRLDRRTAEPAGRRQHHGLCQRGRL